MIVLQTDGSGLWSKTAKTIRCVDFQVSIDSDETDEQAYGELKVYFSTEDWDRKTDGLIYTDKLWIQQLQEKFNSLGLAGDNVDYSEQGMQGHDFVSLDIGSKFIESLVEFHKNSTFKGLENVQRTD